MDGPDGEHEGERPAGGEPADRPPTGGREGKGEGMPAFLRYGVFTVVVYAVAMTVLLAVSTGDAQGPALVTFTIGFLIFMTVYFASMWAGWLFFR